LPFSLLPFANIFSMEHLLPAQANDKRCSFFCLLFEFLQPIMHAGILPMN
jgi:hypothetical protein